VAVLTATGLVRSFGDRRAVDDVGFDIASGETYGLLGPNGAGKTTTISMVCGLLAPDAGSVVVNGDTMRTDRCPAKSHLGLVPQEVALYPDLSARENLAFFGRLQGLGQARLARRVDEVLELVGLADRADERVEDYSGGMQRRCNIGAALLHEPELLILDEPTVGVDPQSRNAILTGIAELQSGGMAVLYTTHYMEEAERLCDRVGIIDLGELKAEGTRRELVGLVGQSDQVLLSLAGSVEAAAAACRTLEPVRDVCSKDERLELVVEDARQILPRILETVAESGASVRAVEVIEPNLEAVFLHLTGKALRD
jgi:ABC-2 type transport system ATP-binding protein